MNGFTDNDVMIVLAILILLGVAVVVIRHVIGAERNANTLMRKLNGPQAPGGIPGSYWVEGEQWFYVDAYGTVRTLRGEAK